MKNLKPLNLSIPTLDCSECKSLMGGDGYAWDLPEVVVAPDKDRPDRPDSSDYDYHDDILDDDQNDYEYDINQDYQSQEGELTNPPLNEEELNAVLNGMNPILAQLIKDVWERGFIVKGDGINHTAKPAYYDVGMGKIVINDFSIDQTILGHEFTHFLQGLNKMLGGENSNIGDANNEFQANFIQMLLDVSDPYGYSNRGWLDERHNENWLVDHVSVNEETGKLSIDQVLWDWLNDNKAMNDAMKDWLDYWSKVPNTPSEYIQGTQDGWDYKWGDVLDQLGISHP